MCHPGAPGHEVWRTTVNRAARAEELNQLLDELSYEVTAARSAGVDRPQELRRAVKKIGKLAADIDALAVTEVAARQKD